MSKKTYIDGFCKVAKAHGVDPRALAKFAEATPFSDYVLGIPGNALIGPLAAPVNTAGYFGGLASDIEGEGKKDTIKALIPGLSAYRMGNRIRSQVLKEKNDDKDSHPVEHAVTEHIGFHTSALAPTIIGALAGGIGGIAAGGDGGNVAAGAGVGAAGGLGLWGIANVISSIAAAVKRRRTKEEQIKHDKSTGAMVSDILVPGSALYNYFKRIGRSQGDREEGK